MGPCNSKHQKVHDLNSQADRKPPSPSAVLMFLAASEKSKSNNRASPAVAGSSPNREPEAALAVPLALRLSRKFQEKGGVHDLEQGQHPIPTPQSSCPGSPHRNQTSCPSAPAPMRCQSPEKSAFYRVAYQPVTTGRKVVQVKSCSSPAQGTSRDRITHSYMLQSSLPGQSMMSKSPTATLSIDQSGSVSLGGLMGSLSPVESWDEEVASPASTGRSLCVNVDLESNISSLQETPGDAKSPTQSLQNSGEMEVKVAPQRAKMVGKYPFISQMEAQMGSKDFQDRLRAIDRIVETCSADLNMITACIFPVFGNIRERLVESNRNVNLHMLRALEHIIPQVRETLPKVVNLLIPAIVDNHLNSKNAAISSAARTALDALLQNVDNVLLVEILATKAQLLGGQAKLDLARAVADMVEEVYAKKPQMVITKVLPLLWHMLAARGKSPATAALLRALHLQMGPKLRSYGATQPPSITAGMERLLQNSA